MAAFPATYRTLKSFTPDYKGLRNVGTAQGMESCGIYTKQNMRQSEYYAGNLECAIYVKSKTSDIRIMN